MGSGFLVILVLSQHYLLKVYGSSQYCCSVQEITVVTWRCAGGCTVLYCTVLLQEVTVVTWR